MSSRNLTQYQIKLGRRVFNLYNGLNSFSFALVTGNIITLYALFLGAGSVVVGLISSFAFLSYFAIPLGRMMAYKKTLVRVFADTWVWRNCALFLMVPIPFTVSAGIPQLGLLLIIISNFLFNFLRGMGMVANNPVISDLAPGDDRGGYIILVSIISNTAALVATLCMAFLLAKLSSMTAFSIAIIIGIVFGMAASFLLYKLPESRAGHVAPEKGRLIETLTAFLKDKNFKMYIAAFSVIGVGVGMARPFIIMYCKDVYRLNDSLITLVSFFSILGALAMGGIMRLFIDRIGAKPMYIVFSALTLLSLIPAVIAPRFSVFLLIPAFLCFLSFATNLGFAGQESAAQAYFFTLIPRGAIMDLSIIYYFILGATGAAGSLFGGVILDGLQQAGFSSVSVYRIFYLMQIVVIGLGVFLQTRLLSLGSYSLKYAIGMFFSLRDLRALNLLSRLERSDSPQKETALLAELRVSNTAAAGEKLMSRLASPRFGVRIEALNSMESLPSLPPRAAEALMTELKDGVYTTAYMAARLLGKFRTRTAIADLRGTISSDDYFLAGEAMIALARLNDERGQMMTGEVITNTRNPHLILWGIHAMEIYGNPASLPILQDLLRIDFETGSIHYEIILALSSLMGFERRFYQPCSRYIADTSLAAELITDFFEEVSARKKLRDRSILKIALDFLEDREKAEPFLQWYGNFSRSKQRGVISALLLSSVVDTELTRLESFRFFITFWAFAVLEDRKLLVN